jgi:hypothetical protein
MPTEQFKYRSVVSNELDWEVKRKIECLNKICKPKRSKIKFVSIDEQAKRGNL